LVMPSAKIKVPLQTQRRISHPGPRLASFNVGAAIASLLDSGWGIRRRSPRGKWENSYLAGVDPLAGERIVVRSHFGGGCRLSLSGLLPLSSRFQVDFRQIVVCILWMG
jgi:hypothetical protein